MESQKIESVEIEPIPETDIPKKHKEQSLTKQYKKEMSVGEIRPSFKKTKKYCVLTPSRKLVHFSDKRKQHYCDTTTLGLYRNLYNKSGCK